MSWFSLFFFNDPATTEIYTLSLHDALPISAGIHTGDVGEGCETLAATLGAREVRVVKDRGNADRKSTRLNSSHSSISYAVFCLKKKKHKDQNTKQPHPNKHHLSRTKTHPTR